MGGGAFGCIYHIGVVKALYKHNLFDINVYGNSAGALAGMFYLLRTPVKTIKRLFAMCVKKGQQSIDSNPFRLSSYQITNLHFDIFKFVNDEYPDAYKQCSHRLKIGVTKTTTGFEWKNEFKSNIDLFNTLLCSFNVPFLCNYDAKLDGVDCIDGGFGFNADRDLPKNVDIKISLYNLGGYCLNANIPLLHRMTPPSKEHYNRYLKNGYKDMKNKINNKNVNECCAGSETSLETIISCVEYQLQMHKLQHIVDQKMLTYDDLVELLRQPKC